MPLARFLLRAAPALVAFADMQPAAAQDGVATVSLSAPPAAVTVYPDQATVTRRGSVEIPAGDSVVVLSSVPAGLVRDTVTAAGRAAGSVSIGSVDVRQVSFDRRATGQRRAELEARVRGVEDEIAAVDVRIASLAAQVALIERLSAGFAEQQRRVPQAGETLRIAADPATWRTAWESVRDGTGEAAEATRVARIQRRELEMRRAALQAEVTGLGTPPAGALEIAVAVRAEAATTLELSISYQVPGARWQPVYEARLDTATRRLTLRQEALVSQGTGEDWDGVVLSLSTARPSADAKPPELRPWRIALVDPAREVARGRGMPMGSASMAPMPQAAPPPAVSAAPEPARDAAVATASVSTTGFAVEYRIPGTATVRADGAERRVRIADLGADAVLAVRAVPRLDPRAFLEARFTSPSPAPTLPGRAALYLDGVLVGRAALPMLRPMEELSLPFGADDRVRVAHAPQGARRAAEGSLLTGRTNTRTNEALITISSFHASPIEVTVLDQVPVSGDEQLSVAVSADPAPNLRDVDNRPGVVGWTMTLAPREEKRIRFGYTVTSPRDREVVGLER